MEAPAGFEPAIRVLQTRALPLGYGARSCHLDKEVYHAAASSPALPTPRVPLRERLMTW
jgi:hypothetical protein